MQASWQYVCAIGCRDDGDKTFERNTLRIAGAVDAVALRAVLACLVSGVIGLPAGTRIWIAAGVTDLRLAFTGLSGPDYFAIVCQEHFDWHGDPPHINGPAQKAQAFRVHLSAIATRSLNTGAGSL
jgi:hypothetical protein